MVEGGPNQALSIGEEGGGGVREDVVGEGEEEEEEGEEGEEGEDEDEEGEGSEVVGGMST